MCLCSQAGMNVGDQVTWVIDDLMGNIPPPIHGQGLHRDPNACWMASHRCRPV